MRGNVKESDWLTIHGLDLESGMLSVADPNLFPSDRVVQLPAGQYDVQVRLLHQSAELTLISSLRVCLSPDLVKGTFILDASCDFAQIGVGDSERCKLACAQMDFVDVENVMNALDRRDLAGIIQWSRHDPGALMPFVRPAYGDGVFPVYELLKDGIRNGVELSFLEEE